ncbi:DUF1133 family protein, partial [Enterobacter roggenkampii]
SGEMVRLGTLECICGHGKLRIWGRWSYIVCGSGGDIFNQLVASGKIRRRALWGALRGM